jgi:hypothetical protein
MFYGTSSRYHPEKDSKGNISKVTFDLKKHGKEVMPILVKLGAVEEDAFEKEWKEGVPVEKAFDMLIENIKERWKNRP